MNHNEKVQKTLDALDLEFEVLSLVQQQSIMGGSGGSSGGAGGPSDAEKLVNQMFGIETTSSGGTFEWAAGTDTATAKASMLKLAETGAGMKLLKAIQLSGQKINLKIGSAGAGGTYNASTNTIDVKNFSSSNGELAAHELFHAYADINGDSGGTNSTETQAYLFQLKYMKDAGSFSPSAPGVSAALSSNLTPADGRDDTEKDFGNSMVSLLSGGYDREDFNTAVGNFKSGSKFAVDTPEYADLTGSSPLSENSPPPLIAGFL